MKCFSFGFARLAQTVTAAALAVALVPAFAQAADYSFSLNGPNTAEDDNGGVLRTTGSGTFDSDGGPVDASGSFTEFDSGGTVVARGTWSATAFVSFTDPGGTRPGFQGGILKIKVTFSFDDGSSVTDLDMKVVCNLPDNPITPGGFQTGQPQGTTVGAFDVATSGFTLFNLIESD